MSSLRKLLNSDGKLDLSLLPEELKKYDSKFSDWKSDLQLKGKSINDVLIEHSSISAYYDQLRAEINTILKYIEILQGEREGQVMQIIREDSRRDYTHNSILLLIKKDKEYVKLRKLWLEVNEMYDKISSVCNQFKQQAYILHSIVEAHKSELTHIILNKDNA